MRGIKAFRRSGGAGGEGGAKPCNVQTAKTCGILVGHADISLLYKL